MRPVRFDYYQPSTTAEAVACLQVHGSEARVLAGGQSLMPLLAVRAVRPEAIVDVGHLENLGHVTYAEDGALRIGALTRHVDIERLADARTRTGFPVLPESAALIGDLPVRTRGTLGGSLAHANPAAEWCVLAVLLDAEVVVVGPGGPRTIPAGEFFTGVHRSQLSADELIVEVRVAAPAPSAALVEFAPQERGMPLVTAAAAVVTDEGGVVIEAQIVVGGVTDRPVRLADAAYAVLGAGPHATMFDDVRRAVAREVDQPPDDHRATGEYRRDLAVTLAARAVQASMTRCQRAHRLLAAEVLA